MRPKTLLEPKDGEALGVNSLPMPEAARGVAIIVWDRGCILLGRRRDREHGTGAWALPGGKLESGEEPRACARRELLEETGLEARALDEIAVQVDDFPAIGKQYTTHFFLAADWAGTPQNREPHKCEAWVWHSMQALPEDLFMIHPSTLAAVRACFPAP